jgi:hypothetical protein
MRARGGALCGQAVAHYAGTRWRNMRAGGDTLCGHALARYVGTRWRTMRARGGALCGQAVVHYATSRKVAVSIPHEITGVFLQAARVLEDD